MLYLISLLRRIANTGGRPTQSSMTTTQGAILHVVTTASSTFIIATSFIKKKTKDLEQNYVIERILW